MYTSRCYYLALAYLRNNRFLESSSLLKRCQEEAREALECLSKAVLSEDTEAEAVPGHSRTFLLQLMRELEEQADTEILACKAGYMLDLAAGGGASATETANESTVSAAIPRAVLKEVGIIISTCCSYLVILEFFVLVILRCSQYLLFF